MDYNHSQGEWSVAYHGIGGGMKGNQLFNSKNSHIINNLLLYLYLIHNLLD